MSNANGDPNPPKRNKSTFLFFCEENRVATKAANSGASFSEIAKILVEKWRAITPEEKEKYETLATQDKNRYLQEARDYRSLQNNETKEENDDYNKITPPLIHNNNINILAPPLFNNNNESTKDIKNDTEMVINSLAVKVTANKEYGLELQFPNPTISLISKSPIWNLFGWKFLFVHLSPSTTFFLSPDIKGHQHIKIIQGQLINFENGTTVTNPYSRRDLSIPQWLTEVTAGNNGALFVYFIALSETAESKIYTMKDSIMSEISGPQSEELSWQLYSDIYPQFKGVDLYNLRGFRLLDFNGNHIAYIQFWSLSSGNDAGYHDHSELTQQNTFCEIHCTLYNGTGHGGMQYIDHKLPIAPLIPLPQGYEHGPLWCVNYKTGEPIFNQNNAVKYNTHRWIAGGIKRPAFQEYDVWVAFEMLPENCIVPQASLTQLVPDREAKNDEY